MIKVKCPHCTNEFELEVKSEKKYCVHLQWKDHKTTGQVPGYVCELGMIGECCSKCSYYNIM